MECGQTSYHYVIYPLGCYSSGAFLGHPFILPAHDVNPVHTFRCDSTRIDEAMQKKSAGHFQLACACAFEGLHGGATNEAGINHPAQVRTGGGVRSHETTYRPV